jgi:DNA-3-methyladenine glycosylase II
MSMKRFRVAGHSMSPTLRPGQEVAATDTRPAEPGNIVVFPHPSDDDLWLIKRLADESGWVVSDNTSDADLDSTVLGPIDPGTMLVVVSHLDASTFAEACELLAAEDDALAGIVERWGVPPFWNRRPGFQTLVLLILEQQVTLESGAAMYRRLDGLLGEVSPVTVVAAGDEGLRSIGITRQKSGYLLDLSTRVLDSLLDLEMLSTEPEHLARESLLAVKGIGAWTADAYLLSAVRRPDMWPVGDRALQVGTGEALGLAAVPDESQLEMLGEPWRPVRAAAARLIWHSYLSERGRVEPPDPSLARVDPAPA